MPAKSRTLKSTSADVVAADPAPIGSPPTNNASSNSAESGPLGAVGASATEPPTAHPILANTVNPDTAAFRRNAERMAAAVATVRTDAEQILQMGGPANVARQHKKDRMDVRERLRRLLDPDAPFFELGTFAAWGMYAEWGGAPSAGVVTGVGRVHGRLVMVIANDATVKAGAFFPMTAKKVIRAQTIAIENRLPTIYLVDSAGVFLPLQEDVFPDQDDFGRIFRNNAVMSAMGIPQITAIMGSCVAGGAYLPVMCDYTLMTEGSGLYLAGPALVRAAIGQQISSDDLGGAGVHASVSGTADFREPDDAACLARVRSLVSRFGAPPPCRFDRIEEVPPRYDLAEAAGIFTDAPGGEYDMRQIIARIVDDSCFDEYKAEYGQTLICGYGRIGGFAVGMVANQKQHVRRPGRPVEFGGVIYHESADKAARFMMTCNQNHIPLVFLHDVNGFMVGRDSEHAGIIRAGAKMVNVISNSVVPKISVILGGSFGAGNYAMCGKAYDPRLLLAWPTAKYAVMGGDQAARTLVDIRIRAMESEGRTLSEAERAELLRKTKETYDSQTDARYAAARLWVDRIIEPAQTREELKRCLEIVAMNPEVREFRTGVLQV